MQLPLINNLANEVSEQLLEHFGDKVYRTIIPRNIRLAEAPSYGLPIIKYDKTSRGAIAYLALAAEMVRRQKAAEEDREHPSMAGDSMPVQHQPENPAA